MTKANDDQVGGSHYKTAGGEPEHWDLVLMYNWDYFQGQITKYLMRWKTKHKAQEKKLEDLKKAAHFLQKYIESVELDAYLTSGVSIGVDDSGDVLKKYEQDHTQYIHNLKFLCEGGYGDGTNLYTCKACRKQVRAEGLMSVEMIHKCDVNQTS